MALTTVTIGQETCVVDSTLGANQGSVIRLLQLLRELNEIRLGLIQGQALVPGAGATELTAVNNRITAIMNALP